MLHYAMSTTAVGGSLTPEVARALRGSTVRAIELILAVLEQDDAQGGPSRAVLTELVSEGTLSVPSLHLPFGQGWDISVVDEDTRRLAVEKMGGVLARNLGFGARVVTLHASAEPVADDERPQRLAQARRSIAELLPLLQRHHLRLAVEFLPRTCLGNCEADLLAMVDEFDHAAVGICLDVNHVMTRHAELPRIIATLRDRLFSLHISDYDGVDEKHWFPGQGIIAWPAVMAALRAVERDLLLIFETRRQLHDCDPIFPLRQVECGIKLLEAGGPAL